MNTLSLIPLFLLLFFLYKLLIPGSTRHKNLPPSPPKLPIFGHLLNLGTAPHRSLQALSARYGELMFLHLGTTPTLVVSSARVAKEILKTNDAIFSSRPKSNTGDKLIYNSRDVASAPYGEYWRHLKSIFVLQLMTNKRVRSFRNIREEETALLVEQIQKSTSAVNLSQLFSTITNDVVCRVSFGRKYNGDQKREIDFRDFLEEFMVLLGSFNIGDFIPWLGWINKLNGFDRRLDETFNKFDTLIEKVLAEHLDGSNKKEDCCQDFVDVLFQIQKENKLGFPLERDSIKALIMDAFAAGTDTTSTLLEWAISELLKNPKIMKELQKEVREITAEKDVVTEDELVNMKYLKAVIKETLRLHPPVPLLIARESTQDSKIMGYDIPAGTMVLTNASAIQRDPMIWEEPETFRPERFLNLTVDFRGHDFELIPFGSGRRICPGINFAAVSSEIVLANVVHKFDWSLPDGAACETLDMSEGVGLTVRRKHPLLAVAIPHVRAY